MRKVVLGFITALAALVLLIAILAKPGVGRTNLFVISFILFCVDYLVWHFTRRPRQPQPAVSRTVHESMTVASTSFGVTIDSPSVPLFGVPDLSPLKERDPNFSEQKLIEKANSMFLLLQEALNQKNWKLVRPFLSDALFNQYFKQIQLDVRDQRTETVEDIEVLQTDLVGYEEDGSYDVMDLLLKAWFKKYTVDDRSRQVVEGSPRQDIAAEYLWKLIRSKGCTTPAAKDTTASRCPNCGADISINDTGACDYCGKLVNTGEFDWMLSTQTVRSQG